jgi:hypothetical protein
MFEPACKLGCEGSVSERRGSIHSAGWSSNWLKVKNPDARAVRREANTLGRIRRAKPRCGPTPMPELELSPKHLFMG